LALACTTIEAEGKPTCTELSLRPSARDCRLRVVHTNENREGSRRHVATRFRVSLSGVRDLLTRSRAPGDAAPTPPERALNFLICPPFDGETRVSKALQHMNRVTPQAKAGGARPA